MTRAPRHDAPPPLAPACTAAAPARRARGVAAALAALVLALLAAACGDPLAPGLDRARVTPGDTLWAAVAVGNEHTCALTAAGRAFCWGSDADGQLGTSAALGDCPMPTSPSSTPWSVRCATTPVAVDGGFRFAQLVATWAGTCGRSPSGAVACWGGGALAGPRQVRGAPPLRTIARGQNENVCGLDADGRAWCWSLAKATGGGGIADTARTAEARPVPGDLRFTALGAECGTTADGALYCWNSVVDTTRFDRGRVVLDTCRWTVGREGRVETAPCSPYPVRLRTTVAMRAPAPEERDCALSAAGVPYCWGWVADLYAVEGGDPRAVPAPAPLVDLTGPMLLCGRTAAGAAYCRGRGDGGLFGNGAVNGGGGLDRWTRVADGWAFAALASSGAHACGVTAGGALVCWGSDVAGQLGSGKQPPAEPCWNPDAYTPPPAACVVRPRPVASIAGR